MAGDFEEKYLLLRDENTALKRKKNEQEATIKRMFTKLAMIEESMKKKKLADGEDNQDEQDGTANKATASGATASAGLVPLKRDLDTEKFVQSLKSENMQLRKKNQALMEKNRLLEEKMRQHQLKYHSNPKAPSASATNASMGANSNGLAMRRTPVGAPSGAKVHSIASRRAAVEDGGSLERQVDHARRQHRDHLSGDLEMALKNRLVIAEKQLVKLQSENEQLRKLSTSSSRMRRSSGGNNNNNNNSDSDEEAVSGDGRISSMDVEHLRRELRDRQAQVAILNARYENLEANNAAEREIQEQTIEQLEHMNRQVHKLRSQLQDLSLEKEDLEVRLSKATDLDREIVTLRDQNRKLEERMTSLCESPFINDAFQRKERIDKLFDLEKLTQQQKTTIASMNDEQQKLQATIKELQSNVKLMKQAKEAVEQDMDKLRQQLADERNARSIAMMSSYPVITAQPTRAPSPRRPSPISTNASIQPERRDAASSPLKGTQAPSFTSSSSTSAMPVVTRRYPDPTLSGALNFPLEDGSEDNSIKHLRNRVHVLQLAHLKAIQELERCEKMLHAQTNINRELAQEIDELTTKNVSSSGALQKRIKELELAADDRQQRIQSLEAQNRQLKYAREKFLRAQESDKKLSELDFSSDEEDDRTDVASVSESLVMAARDLSPGEQLLEIWIIGASFDRTVISSNSSTFVLCDFFDFESQSTPLLLGHRPEYNFSSTFRVTVDAFFLRYLASEMLVFELHQAVQGDFRLIGRASVSLASLLRSKGVIKEPELPIKLAFGAEHDNVIGTLNALVRLAAPISEIWKLHLRSYPQDIQLLRKHSLRASAVDPVDEYLLSEGFDSAQEKTINELQITVFACRGLRSYGKKKKNGEVLSVAPSSYVHYQILGFPDVFTNIVPSSTSPEFDLHVSKQFFAVEVDACLLHFFSKFQLWFTVFDDQAAVEDDSASDGAIGRCCLLLEELVKGEALRGWFQLRDRNDQPAGEISVLIEWRDPFQVVQLYSSARRPGGSRPAADLHSLDYDQQHAIMRLFAPDMDGRVNYRQFLTYALPPESLELVTSKLKERIEYAIDTEQISSVEDLFISAANGKGRDQPLKEISGSELRKRIEKLGAFVSEQEMELLEQVFAKRGTGGAVGSGDSPKMQVHYLVQHINPRISCAERLLLHKIRHTLRVYLRPDKTTKKPAGVSPSQPFDRFDHAQSGFVSRAEFKRCLGVLGFELLDIDKSYKEFVERESRTTASQPTDKTQDPTDVKTSVSNDLDEEVSKKTAAHQPVKSQPAASNGVELPARAKPNEQTHGKAKQVVADPRSEFDRRKEVFLERMKAIASSSAQSLVYEQLEKQKGDRRRVQAQSTSGGANQNSADASLSERVQQKLTQLHVPKPLHHDAARILQRQFRNYRNRQVSATASVTRSHAITSKDSIVHIDSQLQRMLKTWTQDELENLEANIIEVVESELPDARKARVISRKQLSFVLSKIPRIAIEPELLRRLADHFCVSSKSRRGEVAYRPLVHFICSVETDPKKSERGVLPIVQTLLRLPIDANQVRQTMALVGDMNSTGRMSIKRFREAIKRVGLQMTSKDLRALMVLLTDSSGCELFYLALIKILRDSPVAVKMHQVVARCVHFGLTKLREMLVTRVNSDDGLVSREQLHAVLMQENTEVNFFDPGDSYTLMDMAKCGGTVSAEGALPAAKVPIDRLLLTLERLSASDAQPLRDEDLNAYTLAQLQRIAMNCRTLMCPPYSEMLEAFERFDWKESGLVSLTEFEAVVPRTGFVLFTSQQVTMLAKKFGAKLNGGFGVNYRQFLDWTTPSATPEMDAIEAKLRQFASSKSSEQVRITQVLESWREAFSASDKLSSGSVTRGEFAKICQETLRLPLNSDELRVLLFSYDRNMDDSVDYGSFVQLNWKDTSRQVAAQQRKQVQFEHSVPSRDGNESRAPSNQAAKKHGHRERDIQPSEDEEKSLRSAIASAVKYSRKDFDRACAQLEEFCVVYNHGVIPVRKLWKHAERSGLASLLTKAGTSLLIQKFTVKEIKQRESKDEGSNEDTEEVVGVSLKGVAALLRESSKLPNEASTSSRRINDSSEASVQPLETALAAVRRLHELCDAHNVDLQGFFERVDAQYTGQVEALEFKSVLLERGLSKAVSQSRTSAPVEALIGVLVREFRAPDTRDGVHYAVMLTRALSLSEPQQPTPQWFPKFVASLRARIRLRAGFQGVIAVDQSLPQLCKSLDTAFDHFDREQRGFLGPREVAAGLTALKYELSSEQVAYFLRVAGVFRHTTGTGGLSRMEFDSFVLDPSAGLLLRRLTESLYKPSDDDPSTPCVAQLSRLFITRDKPDHRGVLPVAVACKAIADASQHQLSSRDQHRLQILFDVNRDGHFAYKLFMKVLSQWHMRTTSQESSASVSASASASISARAASSKPPRRLSNSATPAFQCTREDVVSALYNQLSSVDFDSQIDIFKEYLKRCDEKRSGCIGIEDVEHVLDRIGLKLSKEALLCLQHSFKQQKHDEAGGRVEYKALLKAIHSKHDDEQES